MKPPFIFPTAALLVCLLACHASAQQPREWRAVQETLRSLQQRLSLSEARAEALQNRVDELQGTLQAQAERAEREREARRRTGYPEASDSALNEALEALADLQDSPGAHSALAVGGYFDIEFRDDDAREHSTFSQHRLILQFSGEMLKDAISFKTEIEIEGGGADVSFLSNNEILVEYAELHFHLSRGFNIKSGLLLVPFGRFNTLHDSPLRDLTDRPLVNRRIIPTTWDDAGIGIYGAWDMFGVDFDYDVVLINGLDEDFSTTPGGGFRGNRNSFRADNNDNKMIIGRLGIRPDLDFFDVSYLGLSFGYGKYDDEDDQSILMFAFDWNLKHGPWELIGEYAVYDLERSSRETALGAPGGAEGFYAQLNYHFFFDSWRGSSAFFTDESTFTLSFRVGNIDTDDSARGIDRGTRGDAFRDDTWRYTIGLNFRPIEKTVIKIEYQFWAENNGIPQADNDRFVISFATYF